MAMNLWSDQSDSCAYDGSKSFISRANHVANDKPFTCWVNHRIHQQAASMKFLVFAAHPSSASLQQCRSTFLQPHTNFVIQTATEITLASQH